MSTACNFLGLDDDTPGPCQGGPGACDNFDDIFGFGSVKGQIDTVFTKLPLVLFPGTVQAFPDSTGDPQPAFAFIGRPSEDGYAHRVGEVGPAGPETYMIDSVSASGGEFLVLIVDTAHHRLGGVLALDLVQREDTLVIEPVTAETSLERAIYQGLGYGHQRIPSSHKGTSQVALVHRFTEQVAGSAVTSLPEIRALVDAHDSAQELLIQSFLSTAGEYDTLRVNGALREPGQTYAEARDGGMPAATAHDTFIDGAIDTYIERVGTPAQVATAWGAFATLHDHELAGRTTLTRLQSAQNLLHISVTARKALEATVADGTAGKAEVSTALDDILAAGMAATGMADFADAVAAEVQEGAAALEAARDADLSAELQAADLSAHIDTSSSPEEIAAGLPDYLTGVESAAGDSELAALLLALMGGPGYGSSASSLSVRSRTAQSTAPAGTLDQPSPSRSAAEWSLTR